MLQNALFLLKNCEDRLALGGSALRPAGEPHIKNT